MSVECFGLTLAQDVYCQAVKPVGYTFYMYLVAAGTASGMWYGCLSSELSVVMKVLILSADVSCFTSLRT
jgi:hypothetical protein